MIISNLTSLSLHAKRITVPGAGQHVCTFSFILDEIPPHAVIMSQAYPFHAIYLNDAFVGSDEFSFITEYDITEHLRIGSNCFRVIVVPNQSEGWFCIESEGLPTDISTNNLGWQWSKDDPANDDKLGVCIRGTTDAPWDGNGQIYHSVPMSRYSPIGIVTLSSQNSNTMFPDDKYIKNFNPDDSIPFEDEITFDFGKETLGYIEFDLTANIECNITLSFAESFDQLGYNPWWHADDVFKVRRGANHIHNPNRKGFRYARIKPDKGGRFVVSNILNQRPGIPLPNKGFFRCSDNFLNTLNEISCYTLELCTQKFLEDGIKRDRLCWTGDLRPEALIMYHQLGETDIIRNSLYSFARHTNEHGVIQPAFPWRTGWVMTDYVMWWIISLWEYYSYTLDIETLRELAPIARKQEKWLIGNITSNGLLITKTDDAPISCWSSRDRDGYTSYHNCLWYFTQLCMNNIDSTLETPGNRQILSLQRLRNTFVDSKGIWRDLDFDGNFRPEIPHDGTINAAMFCNDLASLDIKQSLDSIKVSGWTDIGSPIWWPSGDAAPNEVSNRIMPLYNAYEAEQRIRSGDWNGALEILHRCFGYMLDLGSTTFWEAIAVPNAPDGPVFGGGFGSLCHGWSGYPAAILPMLLGVPCAGKTAVISPYIFRTNLEYAEACIPTKNGNLNLHSEYNKDNSTWFYKGYLPEDIEDCIIDTGLALDEVEYLEVSNCHPNNSGDTAKIGDIKGGKQFSFVAKLI